MQEMTTVSEPVINFGQLLRIKRESLGLNLKEAVSKSKLGLLSAYEKGTRLPNKKTLAKLVLFYGLSESDFNNCKESTITAPIKLAKKKPGRIETIYDLIDSVLNDVNKMDDTGYLAVLLKKTAIDNLTEAKGCLSDLIIIDRLI